MFLGLSAWSRALFQKLTVSHLLKKFSTFYGNRNTALSYPEPAQSDPQPLILLFRSHFNITVTLGLFFQLIPILQVYSPKPCIRLASATRAKNQPISFLLIWSSSWYLARNEDHETSHRIFDVLLTVHQGTLMNQHQPDTVYYFLSLFIKSQCLYMFRACRLRYHRNLHTVNTHPTHAVTPNSNCAEPPEDGN
jgi:hypothetical protein